MLEIGLANTVQWICGRRLTVNLNRLMTPAGRRFGHLLSKINALLRTTLLNAISYEPLLIHVAHELQLPASGLRTVMTT
eukprot:4566910-Amphidinium_carterae.1